MNKIILSSIPRCGSTWLFHSLINSRHSSFTPKNKTDNIEGVNVPYVVYKNYKIYKTHLPYSYWKNIITNEDYVIFLVGDVIESVISTKFKRFDSNHFKNCGYSGNSKNIFKEDFLGYENIFDSWYNAKIRNKIILKYEDFNFTSLQEFMPYDFKFNNFKIREKSNSSKITKEQLNSLKLTYKSLINKVNGI